jgi:hypothetical protein
VSARQRADFVNDAHCRIQNLRIGRLKTSVNGIVSQLAEGLEGPSRYFRGAEFINELLVQLPQTIEPVRR